LSKQGSHTMSRRIWTVFLALLTAACSELPYDRHITSPDSKISIDVYGGHCGPACSSLFGADINTDGEKTNLFEGRGAAFQNIEWLSNQEVVVEFCQGKNYRSIGEVDYQASEGSKRIYVTVITKPNTEYKNQDYCVY